MEYKRIEKVLLSEYCDFSETVLIESPFAETTRDGRGLRQVALGLTPSRLVVAADILKKNSEFTCPPGLDPSIETFELVSVYPLEFVTLSVFRRRRRKTLKARLIDGRAKYYELGGLECRNVWWTVWCSHVRNLLAIKQTGSSLTETSAASSSSASSLYLVSSGVELRENINNIWGNGSRCRVWAHYGAAGDGRSTSWTRKDVYLGPSYDELNHGYYTPVPVRFAGASLDDLNYELKYVKTPNTLMCKKSCSSWPCPKNSKSFSRKNVFERGGVALCDVLFTREHKRHKRKDRQENSGECCSIFDRHRFATASETSGIKNCHKQGKNQKNKSSSVGKRGARLAPKLSRFGFGVRENCVSGLYLEPWEGDREHFRHTRSGNVRVDPRNFIESGVSVWEGQTEDNSRLKKKIKHPRRYALATAAHFFHALGPWSVQPGERESVQRKRASSVVGIRRQPLEGELRLPVSKRQLAASVSMSSLEPGRTGTMSGTSARGRIVLFWTPDYWYRPRAATAAYRELRRHLSLLRDFRLDKEEERGNRNKFFYRRKSEVNKSSCILSRIFSSRDTKNLSKDQGEGKEGENTSQLKRLLRMDLRITAWDLDSTTLARQLTLIDRDLFIRIPIAEIEILVFQRSSRNAPNVGAWIAFSHRISCLTSSEILATKKLYMRTRIIARFINAADKCYAVGNFHSCRSILAGLQSPPIYRLKETWSRLRKHHSTRYETMERLCKIYRNTRSRCYKRAWNRCEKRPPVLPYVGDLLAKILVEDEKISSNKFSWKNRPCNFAQDPFNGPIKRECPSTEVDKTSSENSTVITKSTIINKVEPRQSLGRKFLSAAIIKIRCPKVSSSVVETKENNNKDSLTSDREQILARKFCIRWRQFVARAKILAGNEAKLEGLDPKRRKVLEIGRWISDCQRHAQGYNFAVHSLAWEFLLKARYREDRENFFISLRLESPCLG